MEVFYNMKKTNLTNQILILYSKLIGHTLKAIMMSAVICFAFAVPSGSASAHGSHHHGQSSHSGVYCSYHHKNHGTETNCSKYCKLHKTIHSNGKVHNGVYCSYHHKNHNQKSNCSKYCKLHKTTHSSGKIHTK